jgi:hypothetical protein
MMPFSLEEVGSIDARGADANARLAWTRLGRRYVAKLEVTVRVDDDRTHEPSILPTVSFPALAFFW